MRSTVSQSSFGPGRSPFSRALSIGPIVRVAPDEIDVCDIDIVYDMYKAGSGFLKSEWYDKLTINGVKNIFSVRDPKSHSRRRRLLSAPLSDSSLQSMHSTIDAKCQLAVQRMQQEMKELGVTDVFKWWYFMSTDLIGELTFGHSFQLLERGKVSRSCCSSNQYFLRFTAYIF